MANTLTIGMIFIYIILGIVCTVENNLAKALYWWGASILTTGVLLMK